MPRLIEILCRSCFKANLKPTDFQLTGRGSSKRQYVCPSCGRIEYIDEAAARKSKSRELRPGEV